MMAGAAPAPFSSTELYTRGQPGEMENRGESMVQKHAEKMQKEKETTVLAAIAKTLPNIGQMTHVLALQETDWDLDEAVLLLRKFQMDNLEHLNSLQKKRKHLRDASAMEDEQLKGSKKDDASDGSASSSGSESGSDDDTDDSRENSRHRKKRSRTADKERSGKTRKTSKSTKHKKGKEKSSKSKKGKKRRKESPPAKPQLTHSEDFGKYGILRETDIYEKRSEFLLWAREVKGQGADSLGRYEERDLFKEYMEEYNTATLPHKKYYDLESYENYKAAKVAHKAHKKGAALGRVYEKTAFNDEEELRRARLMERAKQQADRLEEAYKELKHSSKAQDMREQELLRMQMALAYKTGDRAKAQQLLERLKPDDQKKEEERKK